MHLTRAARAILAKRPKPLWPVGPNEMPVTADEAQAIVDRWFGNRIPLDEWLTTRSKSTPGARMMGWLRNVQEYFGVIGVKGSFVVLSPSFVQDAYSITAEPSEAGDRLTFYYRGAVLRLSEYDDRNRHVQA